METSQTLHALFDIFVTERVANPRTLQKFGDLVAVIRVDIGNVIADVPRADDVLDSRLLSAVDQLVGSLAGDAHDIFFIFAGKQK